MWDEGCEDVVWPRALFAKGHEWPSFEFLQETPEFLDEAPFLELSSPREGVALGCRGLPLDVE